MKSINKYLIVAILALSFGLSSCNEWLDLKPESEIILDEYWKTEADVEGVLAACYRGMTESNVIYRMIVWGELRSDNMTVGSGIASARYDMKRILDGDITADNEYSNWSSFYSVINYCNNLLHFAPQVVDADMNFTQADLLRVKSEVLTIRALNYFYLVRAFKDVPFFEYPIIDDSDSINIAKSTEDEILDQLVEDLKYAKSYARDTYGANDAYNKGRITKNAIRALLADIYLWREQYQESSNECSEILADNTLMLTNSQLMYQRNYYLGNSDESIFELQFDDNVQKNDPVFNLYGVYGDPFGDLSFPATLAYSIQTGFQGANSPFAYLAGDNYIESVDDIRALQAYYLSGGKFFIFKYAGISAPTNALSTLYSYRINTPNWIMYRLADVILMKAEAEAELYTDADDASKAHMTNTLTLVNKTYARSNPDSLSHDKYTDITKVKELVLRERQRELLFEGKRWFDLMRLARREESTASLNKYVEAKETNSNGMLGAKVLDAMYMPISQRELEANPKLEQNPFYKETSSTSTR